MSLRRDSYVSFDFCDSQLPVSVTRRLNYRPTGVPKPDLSLAKVGHRPFILVLDPFMSDGQADSIISQGTFQNVLDKCWSVYSA